METYAPPFDSLPDDHDLLASDVVDFTPAREVTFFDPSSKTWRDAIATRSDSLLKPPVHGDFFSDNSTTHAASRLRCASVYYHPTSRQSYHSFASTSTLLHSKATASRLPPVAHPRAP